MSSFEIYRLYQKTASSRGNGLAKPQARLLHAVCACNYIHLPLTRQHKLSAFVSRFTPSRRFLKYSTSSKLAIQRLFRHRMASFAFAEQCKNKRRGEHFDCRARLDYGTNPLCASERSESNFQFRTTVDSSAMFPPRACFCDYPIICKTRHLT